MVVPPGTPGSGSGTGTGGTDNFDVPTLKVPGNEKWHIQAIAAQNQTNVCRINFYIGDGHNWSLIHSATQSTTSDWVFANWGTDGIEILSGQQIRIQFVSTVLNDVLTYNYLVRIERVGGVP